MTPEDQQAVLRAITAGQFDMVDAALDELEKEGSATREWLFYFRGYSLRFQERFNDAIQMYNKALAIDPHFHWAMLGIGVCYQQLGDLDRAAGWFERVLQIAPTLFAAHNSLGYTHRLAGRHRIALTHYQKAQATLHEEVYQAVRKRNANKKEFLDLHSIPRTLHVGTEYFALLHEEFRVDGRWSIVMGNIGACLNLLGELEKAADAYREAISFAPPDSPTGGLERELDSILARLGGNR